MAGASVASSTINFSKAVVGSSLLVMPAAFAQTGVLLGIVLYLTCTFVHGFGLHLVAVCVLKGRAQGQEVSFQSLAQEAFGGKVATSLVATCVMVTSYGTAVGVLIVTGHLFPEISEFLGADVYPWNSSSFWITVVGWGFAFPMCFLSKLDSLKFVSFIGTSSNLYLIIVLFSFATGILPSPPSEQSITIGPPPNSKYTSKLGVVQAFSLFMFSLISTTAMPTVVLELENPTIRRIDTIIILTNVIVATIYMGSGICGSVAFGGSVEVNVLKSFPNVQGTAGGSVAIGARVVILSALLPMVPIWMHPFRGAVSEIVLGKAPSDLKVSVRTTVTFVLFLLIWGVAVAFDNLDSVLALTGASSQMMNGFCFPALFYLLGYLGVSSRGEDNRGIGLTSRGSELAEDGGSVPRQGQSTLKKPAWFMLVTGIALIPVMLFVEFWKIFNEH